MITSDGKTGGRAAIYVRVSREMQADNYSIPTQLEACRAYAAERQLTVNEAHVYREVHTASELYERPALAACREAMARGEFDVLICYDPDRFSRNQIHTALLQHYCDRDGVGLKFAAFDFEDSPTGRFLLQARAFAAELELEKIKERTMRGHRGRATSGKLMGTTPAPFGYRYTDATRAAVMIDPATGPIVRQMFARIVEGWTLRAVAADLNRRGIPTPRGGDRWLFTAVKSIVSRRCYLGEARALTTRTVKKGGKKVIIARPESEQVTLPEGTIPPLIDRETFGVAQARLARNKVEASRNSRRPEAFLLRAGYLRCAHCGRGVATAIRKERSGAETPIYRTHKDQHPAGCLGEKASISAVAGTLDERVWAVVQEYMLEPEKFASLMTTTAAIDPTADALAAVESLIADVEKKQANLVATMMLISNDDARAPLAAQMEALAGQRRRLLAEREGRQIERARWEAGREQERGLIAWWRNAAANVGHFDYAGKRDALDRLGIRVKIDRDGTCVVIAARNPEQTRVLCTLPEQPRVVPAVAGRGVLRDRPGHPRRRHRSRADHPRRAQVAGLRRDPDQACLPHHRRAGRGPARGGLDRRPDRRGGLRRGALQPLRAPRRRFRHPPPGALRPGRRGAGGGDRRPGLSWRAPPEPPRRGWLNAAGAEQTQRAQGGTEEKRERRG